MINNHKYEKDQEKEKKKEKEQKERKKNNKKWKERKRERERIVINTLSLKRADLRVAYWVSSSNFLFLLEKVWLGLTFFCNNH